MDRRGGRSSDLPKERAIDIDPEKVIIDCLETFIPELTVGGKLRIFPQPPRDWDKGAFLVVRATPGGSSANPRHYLTCYFEVEAFAGSRGDASSLARQVEIALARACAECFRAAGGYMFRFREVTAPAQVYDGLSSKHGDTCMFQGTYQISVRPLR